MIRRLLSLAAAVALAAATPAPGAAQGSAAPTVVYLVRHAEKAPVPGNDPPLSAMGEARAADLAEALADADIEAVHVTDRQRTRATAARLLERLRIEPVVTTYGGVPAAAHARAVADTLLRLHRGRRVLVVGHSNTVPLIVRALGGTAPDEIPDNEYDNLYIVTIPASGPPTTVRARFGRPNAVQEAVPNRM